MTADESHRAGQIAGREGDVNRAAFPEKGFDVGQFLVQQR